MILKKDLTDLSFGRLKVERFWGRSINGRALWQCVCSCGKSCIKKGKYLLNGDTRSCGCLHNEHLARVRPKFQSEETKMKIGLKSKGRPNANKGKKFPPRVGWVYKSALHKRLRASFEYGVWRRSVFKRDKYKCTNCGDDTGGNLEADHIKPFAFFPDLRFVVSNGRTLCKPCHRASDTYGCRAWKHRSL